MPFAGKSMRRFLIFICSALSQSRASIRNLPASRDLAVTPSTLGLNLASTHKRLKV